MFHSSLQYGETALFVASGKGAVAVVQLLIENGADICICKEVCLQYVCTAVIHILMVSKLSDKTLVLTKCLPKIPWLYAHTNSGTRSIYNVHVRCNNWIHCTCIGVLTYSWQLSLIVFLISTIGYQHLYHLLYISPHPLPVWELLY